MFKKTFLVFASVSLLFITGCPKKHSRNRGTDGSGGEIKIPEGGQGGEIEAPAAGTGGNGGSLSAPEGGTGGSLLLPVGGDEGGTDAMAGTGGAEPQIVVGGTGGEPIAGGGGGEGNLVGESLRRNHWNFDLDKTLPNECAGVPTVEPEPIPLADNHVVLPATAGLSSLSGEGHNCNFVNENLGVEGKMKKTFVKWTPTEEGIYTFTSLFPLELFRMRAFRDCTNANSILFDSGPLENYELNTIFDSSFPVLNNAYQTHGRIVVGPGGTVEEGQPVYFSLETKCSEFNVFFQLKHADIHIVHTENPVDPEFIAEPFAWFSSASFERFFEDVDQISSQKDFHFVINARDPNLRIRKARIRFFEDEVSQEPLPLGLPFQKEFEIEPLNNLPQSLFRDPAVTPLRAGGYLTLHGLIENISPYYFENASRAEVVIFDDEGQELFNRQISFESEVPAQVAGELCYPNQVPCEENHVCRDAEDRTYRCMAATSPEFRSIEFFQHSNSIVGVIEILDDTFDLERLVIEAYESEEDDDPVIRSVSFDYINPIVVSDVAPPNFWNPSTQESQRKNIYTLAQRIENVDTLRSLTLRAIDSSGRTTEQEILADQIIEAPTRLEEETCDLNAVLDQCIAGSICVEGENDSICKRFQPVGFSSLTALVDQEAKVIEIEVEFEEPMEDHVSAPWGFTYTLNLDNGSSQPNSPYSSAIFNRYIFDGEGKITGAGARLTWQRNLGRVNFETNLEGLAFGLVDRFGFDGEELHFLDRFDVWEESPVPLLERPYPGCLLDEDCEDGFLCRDPDGDSSFECIEDVPPTISSLEVWLTHHGKKLFFDVRGQNPQIVNTTLGSFTVTDASSSLSESASFIFGLPVDFVDEQNRLDIDEDGNYHWEILTKSNFFVSDSAFVREFFDWEYHLGFFDPHRFFNQYNRATVELYGVEASFEADIQIAEDINLGGACDAKDYRRQCIKGSVCIDPEENVFGDGVCAESGSADAYAECPPHVLFDDIDTENPAMDEDGELYFESRAVPTNHTASLACSLNDVRNVRVHRFVAPEASYYLFSTGHAALGANPSFQSMAIRTHCADEQTELACVPYAGTASQVLFLEADEQVFVYLANYSGRAQILNSNFRIYPYEPNRILEADEVEDGQQAPIARYIENEPFLELQYRVSGRTPTATERAYRIEFLDENGAALSTDAGESVFTLEDWYEIDGTHLIRLSSQALALLGDAQSLRVRPGLWSHAHIPNEPFAFSAEATIFPVEQVEPPTAQEGQDCLNSLIPSQTIHCADGLFCGEQINAEQHPCALSDLGRTCVPFPAQCSFDECPADWNPIDFLNDPRTVEVSDSEWLFEGSLHLDDRAGVELEFHGIADCLTDSNNDINDDATGFSDLFSFTAPSAGTYKFTLNPTANFLKLSIRDHCILRENNYCNRLFNGFRPQDVYNVHETYELELQQNQTIYLLVDSSSPEDRKPYSLTVQHLR